MPYNSTELARAAGRVLARFAQANAATASPDDVIDSAPLLKEWRPGTMTDPVTYEANDVRTDENQPWRCVLAHSHYGEEGRNPAAATARALWAPYHARTARNALPYVAPTNATDAYNTGEWMIWTDGLRYMANRDAVTYGPDILPDAWTVEAE